MATTSLVIGNELLSTTLYVLHKEWRDALHTSVAFLDAHAMEHGEGKPVQEGGTRIVQPVGLGDHSTATKLDTGFERIDLSVRDVLVPASYDWAHIVRPIAISGEEERTNSGASAIIKIAEARAKAVAGKMRREFNQQIVAGNVPKWDRLNSLNGVDVQAGNDGFLEHEVVGSQTNTVGGISKTTYSSAPGWQNQSFDGSNSFNANGLNGLYTLATAVKSVSAEGKISCWLASLAGFNNLKRALQANERYVDQSKIDGGRVVQLWNGAPIYEEYYMPDSGLTTITTPVSFYALNLADIHMEFDPTGYFEMDDFEFVSGEYDVRSAKLRFRGQLIAKLLGSSGLAHSLDTF